MDETSPRYCPSCGKAVKEGASFCTSCGAALGGAAPPAPEAPTPEGAAATPPPDIPPVPPAAPGESVPITGAPGAPPPMEAVPVARKSKAPLVLGIAGGLLVLGGIVVLVLWLALWRGGAGGTGDPMALAEKYIAAMEKGDVDAYMDCFEPDFFSLEENPLLEGMGMDVKKMLEMAFKMSEISFRDVKLELRSERGDAATVETTSGTLVASVMGFEQKVDLADDPLVFEMVKKGGRWYLTDDPMPGSISPEMDFEDMDMDMDMDLDTEDLEGQDLEDLEQMLPEDLDLEDLENMSPDELMRLLEELERMLEEMPSESSGT